MLAVWRVICFEKPMAMRPMPKDRGQTGVFPWPFEVQELLFSTRTLLRVRNTLWLARMKTEKVSNSFDLQL